MTINRILSVTSAIAGLVFFASFDGVAQTQGQNPCQSPPVAVAVYDMVPDGQLQTTDFRPLMPSETAFVQKLRDAENFDVADYTTQLPPPEIMPEPPRITGELIPAPSQLPEPYFFTGQITRVGNGFQLDVQLKRSADSVLLNDVKTPFATAAGADAAGTANAAAMLAYLEGQAKTTRSSRESGDHAIDPHIDLVIDKLQLKPNETSPVKIVLSDCDGVRLKHRKIEAYTLYKRGDQPVQENTLERLTDDKGERTGDIGSTVPAVITYIAKFKYVDIMGTPRERTDTKTIVVTGGEAHMWQMRADITYETSTLYFSTDVESGRWSGRRYLIRKKASMVFVFKADDSDASGDVAVDVPQSYNGFGEVYYREKSIKSQDSAEVRTASGILDHSKSAEESIQAAFSISPANNEFQVSLNNVQFAGTEELFAVQRHPANYVHKTGIEYHENLGAGGSAPITPQMKSSGVYRFTKYERKPIDSPEGDNVITKKGSGTHGYEMVKYEFEVRRLSPASSKIIKR